MTANEENGGLIEVDQKAGDAVDVRDERAAELANVFALIDEAREQAGLPKNTAGLFIGYVEGVGIVVDM